MSERIRKLFRNVFRRKDKDNIEIQEKEKSLSPEPQVEKPLEGTKKPGKFRRFRKRMSRLFGCRKRQCSSDLADELEFPQEDVEEAVTPVPSEEEDSIEIIYLDESQKWMEEEQDLFRPLTLASFRRQCWMETADPAWNPLDYSTNIASIPVCYQDNDYIEVISLDDTESEEIEIEILRPITPAPFRRHYWIENEEPAWNPLVCSSSIEFTPVLYLEDDGTEVISLDDIEREWIEEDIIRPITPDHSRRSCSIENEDIAWEPPRCSSNITPITFESQENDKVVLYKLEDSQRKWIKEEHERIRMMAPVPSEEEDSIEIIYLDESQKWMEEEQDLFRPLTLASFRRQCWMETADPAWNPLVCSSSIEFPPVLYLEDDGTEVISLDDIEREWIEEDIIRPITPDHSKRSCSIENEDIAWEPPRCSSNITPITFDSQENDEVVLYKLEDSQRKWIEEEHERIRMMAPGLRSFAHPENCGNTRFDDTIQSIDTGLNHTSLVCGTPPSIDDFNIHSLLGEGSFGKVYKATYRKTGRPVALKAIESYYMDEPTAFARVLREQRILLLAKKENCHFLTRLFASFSTEHYICLAMDFAEGGDLQSYLVRNRMSQDRLIFYSACMVLGLQFLHDRNIAHRDIKLENVLLDRDGYAKITDFGISREGMSFTDISQTQCGTVPYMAPEYFTQDPYTRSVDWWALGVCIYLMRFRSMPFSGDNKDEIIYRIVYEEPIYPPSLTPETYNIIAQLLTKYPHHRLGSGINGAEDVKKSDFFEGLDWEALQRKELQPPFRLLEPPEITFQLLNETKMALKELDYPVSPESSETET